MTEHCLIKFMGENVEYKCPHCGEINIFKKSTIDMFIENNINYVICEGCGTKINYGKN